MSKKLFLTTLATVVLIALEGSQHCAMSDLPGCVNAIIDQDSKCDLRWKYVDCNGHPQTNTRWTYGESKFRTIGPTVTFECAGGLGTPQTLDVRPEQDNHFVCRYGAWGSTLVCNHY